MISSPKAGSSMCGDPNQVRYQKALKQITKLINFNNELKDELASANEELSNINENFQYKDKKINDLAQENEYLQLQLNDLTRKYMDLEEENLRLNVQISELKNKSQISFKAGNSQSKNLQKNRPFSKQMAEQNLHSSSYQLKKIEDLEKTLAQKSEQVKELYSSNNQLKNKLEQVFNNTSNFPSLKNNYNHENVPLAIDSVKQNIIQNDLQRKLRLSQEWNSKLNSECAELKAKLLQHENRNNALIRVKSEKMFEAYSPVFSPRSYHPDHNHKNGRDDTQLVKKAKKLEKQNLKLEKNYRQNQNNFQHIKRQLKEKEASQKKLKIKTEGYEKIIEKQEKQMEEMMKQYEKQLQNYRDEFKEKLEEQRKSFSPAKNSKTEKILQTFQVENKALKKKFQLCSIELTKCFKTLEAYKAKLAQCQKDYNQLARDREQLLEKLTKIQGSHRDRSSHSRNSIARQQTVNQNFGNSSIIQDV